MDSLLASYGSDDEEYHEKEQEDEKKEKPQPRQPGMKSSLFGALPPPKHSTPAPPSRTAGSLSEFRPAPQSLPVVESGEADEDRKPGLGLFAKLPAPRVAEFGIGNGNGNGSSSRSSLFAALPPPKAEFDSSRVKVEAGSGPPKVKKQVVAFKPPIDVSVLDEDDDGWRPGQKRAKVEPAAAATSGGGLQALLPAPKNSLGLGSGLGGGGGGRRAAMEVAGTRSQDVKTEPVAVNSRTSAPSAAGGMVKKAAYDSQGRAPYDDSVYAVDESAAYAPQVPYSNEACGWTAPQGAYAPAQSMHDVNEGQDWQDFGSASYASQSSQASYAPANSAPVSDPVAQVLQAERRRGREDKMAAPYVIEVKQADLTGGKVREDQLRTTGIAFGPSYQPTSSSKDKPSKIHRRKHQIGTLLHDMKAREMELLDRRAKGSLTKAETQAKYGW